MRWSEPWKTAVEKLYKEMYPALHVYALRILGDDRLAEEACKKRVQRARKRLQRKLTI